MTDSATGRYRAYLLGAFEIAGDRDVASTAAWRSQQNRTILKVLLLRRRHVVMADELLDLLWPEEDPGVARPRLYVRLSQLRRMLDPEDPQAHIQSVDGGGYRLETQPQWWVDVDAFEAAAEQGRDAQEAGAIADAIAAYEEARRLYRGDFLEEERYVDWALGERERLLERYLTLLTELAEAYAQQGRYRRAIALYQRVLDRDPYREAVFTRLMLTYAHAGEQTQALRAFERCRRLLVEEMGVEPLPATQALVEKIRTGALWADDDGLRYPPPAYDGRLFDIPYSLAHTPFVGREREYAWLVSRWQQARPGLVLVEGEAGVGKTRLVEEMLGFVERQGARVLRTPPLPEGTALPYASLIEGLRPLWHPGAASGLPGLHRRTLDTFFASGSEGALHPSLSLSERPVGREGAPATSSIEHAISGWLQAQVPPETLLFIDDGPRLDTDSLALIEALAQGLTVIVTARTDELSRDHPLRVAFHILAQAQQADHLRVGRLSEASVVALVQQLARGDATDLIAQVASRTGGNPLFTVATLQTFFERGALYVDDTGCWVCTDAEFAIPPTVIDLIEERLQRLDREQRHTFDAIAIIGQDFDFPVLQCVIGGDEAVLLNTLDALLELGLIVEPRALARGEFAPAHALYVEVTRATLPRVRARQLHGRVADALGALYPDDAALSARLAYHTHQAARMADAVPHAVRAGEVALGRYAIRQALVHFEDAAAWAADAGWVPEPSLRVRLHAGWAEALRRNGQPEAAFTHHAEALPHAQGAVKLHVVYQMAALQAVSGEGAEAFSRWAETLGPELSEPWLLGMLRCSQAFWAALDGDPARARQCAAEGWSRLRQIQDEEEMPPWLLDRATIILARTHALWGEWRLVRRYASKALARNTARYDAYGVADAHVTLAQAFLGLGRAEAARAHAEEALTGAEDAGDLRLQGKALHALALALSLEGAPAQRSEPLIGRLLDIAEQTGDLEAYARGQLLRAQRLQRAGELDAALGLLQPLLARARAVRVPSYIVVTLRQLAEVQIATGDTVAARTTVDEGLALARRCRMRHEATRLASLAAQVRRS